MIAFLIALGDIQRVSSSISTVTTFAFIYFTALAVATKVKSGIITSSSFVIPKDTKVKCRAVVPFDVATAYLVSQNFANFSSNISIYFPRDETHPDFIASVT